MPDSSDHSLNLMKLFVFRLFGWSISLFSKHNERCERQYRHEPPPAFALHRQGSPSFQVQTLFVLLKPLSRSLNICMYLYIYKIHVRVHIQVHIRIRSHISISVKNLYIYLHVVTDTTTFEMELCGHKQATAQAHVRPHAVCD